MQRPEQQTVDRSLTTIKICQCASNNVLLIMRPQNSLGAQCKWCLAFEKKRTFTKPEVSEYSLINILFLGLGEFKKKLLQEAGK